jgi:hypothetical protein
MIDWPRRAKQVKTGIQQGGMDQVSALFVRQRLGQSDFRQSFAITPSDLNDPAEAIAKVKA